LYSAIAEHHDCPPRRTSDAIDHEGAVARAPAIVAIEAVGEVILHPGMVSWRASVT